MQLRHRRGSGLSIAALGTAVIMLTSACATTEGEGASGGDGALTIGALYPLTGPLAALGIEQSNGVKLAVEFVNEQGGINGKPVKIKFQDASSSSAAASGVKRLIDDGVPVVFGTSSSGFSLAASPIAERAKIPYVETGALNEALVERGFKYYFRTRSANSQLVQAARDATAEVIAPGLGKDAGDIKAALVTEDGPFGAEINALLKKSIPAAGQKIVSDKSYSGASTKSFASIIADLKQNKPDVLYWAAFNADAIAFWQQSRQARYTPPAVVAFASGPGTPDFLKAFGPQAVDGIFVVDAPVDVAEGASSAEAAELLARFKKEYKKRFKNDVTGNAMVGFNGAWAVLGHALAKSTKFSGESVRSVLVKADVPMGSLPDGGGLKFNDKGQNERVSTALLQWQNGKLVTVWPEKLAVAKPAYMPLG